MEFIKFLVDQYKEYTPVFLVILLCDWRLGGCSSGWNGTEFSVSNGDIIDGFVASHYSAYSSTYSSGCRLMSSKNFSQCQEVPWSFQCFFLHLAIVQLRIKKHRLGVYR